jgi:hypothetical protein
VEAYAFHVPEPRDPRDDRGDHDHHDQTQDQPEQTADELAWQSIVDNYGDRAELDDRPEQPAEPQPPASDAPFGGRFGDPSAFLVDEPDDPYTGREPADVEEEGYVPPPPPPLPVVAPDRGLAWAGVFGSPIVLLVALIVGIDLPSWLGYLLIAAFVGGFVYLVLKMPREPRDPWDDGAQV